MVGVIKLIAPTIIVLNHDFSILVFTQKSLPKIFFADATEIA